MKVGDKAPNFCLPDSEENTRCLEDYKGKWVVLYFYPKDNTSGCSREAKDFSEKKGDFEKLNAVILGVSKDSPKSHRKFIEKLDLTITLLSDVETKILQEYGAWGKKKNYGREYFGTIRSSFLIDPEGRIAKIWSKVKVAGHVEEVYETLKELAGKS